MPQEQTEFFGKDTNHPFSLYPDDDESTVKSITVWAGLGSGDAEGFSVLKGIQLTWENGEEKRIYNHPVDSDTSSTYTFKPGETAVWDVRAGWRVVQFNIRTSSTKIWSVGKDDGTLHPNVADGRLIGFEGSSGWEIDYISLRYWTID
ncbi:uncharacterized protein B0J16DRAFT_392705 [Fusarium flagelliforme]|uniref:Mannose-binding lectin n=1 Tax=Fusarium flagelliforme TaxID=2675880 RepID=A0A395MWE8_9HYPO|nr:uncharacterized protein B0J16DRAFT_392705 [Fusarium flagelliforme]KAH7198889.1 hypothetical protein B0J16DRAFT_392705 [Fusarium flagelliforme]RFN51763.1 mannose-binding lectin [Fusarium flagelliforme]